MGILASVEPELVAILPERFQEKLIWKRTGKKLPSPHYTNCSLILKVLITKWILKRISELKNRVLENTQLALAAGNS